MAQIGHLLERACARCKTVGILVHWLWMNQQLVRVCEACHTECHMKKKEKA